MIFFRLLALAELIVLIGAVGCKFEKPVSSIKSDSDRPACFTNGGQGFGMQWDCENGRKCSKQNSDYTTECVVFQVNWRPLCKSNSGQGFGNQWDCEGGKCSKENADYTNECVVNNGNVSAPRPFSSGDSSRQSDWEKTGGLAAGGDDYDFTFYESTKFYGKCPKVEGARGGFSPSEGSPLVPLRCTDNWTTVEQYMVDSNRVPDIEESDSGYIFGQSGMSHREFLEKAYAKCAGKCVKKENGVWKINQPSCEIADGYDHNGGRKNCSKNLYKLSVKGSGQIKTVKVFVQSFCPASHWKNHLKSVMSKDNPCKGNPMHIDLEKETLHGIAELNGLSTSDQSSLKVRLTK